MVLLKPPEADSKKSDGFATSPPNKLGSVQKVGIAAGNCDCVSGACVAGECSNGLRGDCFVDVPPIGVTYAAATTVDPKRSCFVDQRICFP